MALHIIKLCVGVETFEELDRWFREEELAHASQGVPYQPAHTTRMFPKRVDEILNGGSLYWVIKGVVQARQRIMDLRPVKGADGIERCDIVLEPVLHRTEYQPRRAFQGWRYLDAKDAPPDIRRAEHGNDIPEGMRQELRRLALI
ncbi:DUF1489 family protein [Oryzibacter oryziterrae]|uniref:DUF1489 family protein n=1 Tax=Oryzibacter oryziterrae TaxID=2766474 RepID=UPI001F17A969|nr:DUF1489 domain-containing protein [Oryzibacter oryziterrae]